MARYFAPTPTYTPLTINELMTAPLQIIKTNTDALEAYNKEADKAAALRTYTQSNPELQTELADYYNALDESANIITGMNQSGFFDNRIKQYSDRLTQLYRDKPYRATTAIEAYNDYIKKRPTDDLLTERSVMDYYRNPLQDNNYLSISALSKIYGKAIEDAASTQQPTTQSTNDMLYTYKGFSDNDILVSQNNQLKAIVDDYRKSINYNNLSDEERQRADLLLQSLYNQNRGTWSQVKRTKDKEKEKKEIPEDPSSVQFKVNRPGSPNTTNTVTQSSSVANTGKQPSK